MTSRATPPSTRTLVGLVIVVAALSGPGVGIGYAQGQESPGQTQPPEALGGPTETPVREAQVDYLRRAAVRLPIAAGLAVILAMRPRRKGTPHRRAPVIQTQIILAIVGAVVMLVVGASLARAFGIVGAAGLVRYRAKIDDPKDAGVMLSTLAVGLAAGVGLWMLALFATGFILIVLGVIESFEPKTTLAFELDVKAKDAAALKPRVEQLMRRAKLDYEARTTAEGEIAYDVTVPLDSRTDRLPDHVTKLDPENVTSVEWKEKKEKKEKK